MNILWFYPTTSPLQILLLSHQLGLVRSSCKFQYLHMEFRTVNHSSDKYNSEINDSVFYTNIAEVMFKNKTK